MEIRTLFLLEAVNGGRRSVVAAPEDKIPAPIAERKVAWARATAVSLSTSWAPRVLKVWWSSGSAAAFRNEWEVEPMGFFAKEDVYALCPCGSGKKYKFCCLSKDREERRARQEQPSVEWNPRRDSSVIVADLAEGERCMREGLRLLESGESRKAIPFFERSIRAAPFIPQPHNNLALAYFMEGDADRAIRICEEVDRRIDPGNAFSLGSLVQYYLLLGREVDARRALDRLLKVRPRDEFGTYKKCEALARFRDHGAILATIEAEGEAGEAESDIAFYAGTALGNLGRREEALPKLRKGEESRVHGERAKRYARLLARGAEPGSLEGDWPYLEPGHWLPSGLLDRLKREGGYAPYPGLAEAFLCLANDMPERCADLIPSLALIGTPRAREILRKIAAGTFGTDEARIEAARSLVELEGRSPAEPTRVWYRGDWKDLCFQKFEITGEAPSRLPEHLVPLSAEMLEANNAGDHARAEALGRELLAKAPDCPSVHQNLAAALLGLAKTDEAEQLFRQAIALDPSYLFAPASLAMMLLDRGRWREARDILAKVVIPDKVHPKAYEVLLEAQCRFAFHRGDPDGVFSTCKILEKVAPASKFLHRMKEPRIRAMLELIKGFQGSAREAEARRRQRHLSSDPGLDECLSDRGEEGLQDLAERLEAEIPAKLKGKRLRRTVADLLMDKGRLQRVVQGLPEGARTALQELLDAGGEIPYTEFTRRHGSFEEDFQRPLDEDGPDTAVRVLRELGLVHVGTIAGLEKVVVPREIRQSLRPPGAGT